MATVAFGVRFCIFHFGGFPSSVKALKENMPHGDFSAKTAKVSVSMSAVGGAILRGNLLKIIL